MSKGFVTIPTDSNLVEETKKYIDYWGADAIRDCDGVKLPDDVKQFGTEVYKAYFIVREDHEYPKTHKEYLQNIALISKRHTSFEDTLKIDLLDDIYKETVEVNTDRYKEFWQVIDRTTGEETKDWDYLGNNIVRINHPIKFHEYTINYFVKNIWDPVQVYNYFSNGWTVPKDVDIDPIYPEALNHMLERMEEWLKNHPEVTVVRFTTFFYNFFIVYRRGDNQSYWDWHTYAMSASPAMFDLFKKTYGYEVKLEDIVTGGYYASRFMIPSKATRDYMDLVQKKCCEWAKMFVDLCHKYGKKAMMFDGDHRIGTEPYNPYFKTIGLDAVVGAPHSGPYIRLLSDMEGVKYKEGRFAPYFFPNECPSDKEGTQILTNAWNSERRGMLRKPIDRIGFGGYLKLAIGYPTFVEKVKQVCDEFRLIKEKAKGQGSYTHIKVALVTYFGRLNSWMVNGNFTDDAFQDAEGYKTIMDALAGQPVDLKFISFDDLKSGDISQYDCIINEGIPGTSVQGGEVWKDAELKTKIREYVYNGGGFIGFGEPTGYQYEGRYIQLSDVLGIEKECGFSYAEKRFMHEEKDIHFIEEGIDMSMVKFTPTSRSVYSTTAKVLKKTNDAHYGETYLNSGNLNLSVNTYGKGRAVYISGVEVSYEAYRLIYRSLLWASHKEDAVRKAFSTDVRTDCYYYEATNTYAVLNSSNDTVITTFYDMNGKEMKLTLAPTEIRWIE